MCFFCCFICCVDSKTGFEALCTVLLGLMMPQAGMEAPL